MAKKVKKFKIASSWPQSGSPMNTGVMPSGSVHPMVPMSPAMVTAIKASPKGKIPPGLARYLAAKKAAKGGK